MLASHSQNGESCIAAPVDRLGLKNRLEVRGPPALSVGGRPDKINRMRFGEGTCRAVVSAGELGSETLVVRYATRFLFGF